MIRVPLGRPCLLLAAVCLGCGQQPVNIVPASFSRPQDLAFTCLKMELDPGDAPGSPVPVLVPLDECKGLQGTKDETHVEIALLTQTSTGEVAAIDLRSKTPLDSRDVVPGYTFLRVGEVPSGIALSASSPHVTYVANFGSQSVMALPTVWLFPPSMELVDQAPSTFAYQNVNLPGAPTDLLLTDDGGFLLAPIPSLGVLVQLAIDTDGGFITDAMGNPIVVEVPLMAASTAPVPPPNDSTVLYGEVCNATPYPIRAPTTTARTPVTLGLGPEPLRLISDGTHVLVADGSEPVVHRLELGAYGVFTDATATSLQSYTQVATAVPVLDLAVTPAVPRTLGATAASDPARFLYAIDATDQSILAVDYLEASATFGAVVATHVGSDATDRVRTHGAGRARALTIVEPGYYSSGTTEAPYCTVGSTFEPNAGPGYLRGVFLVSAMTDGGLRFLDVHDLDATCRGSTSNCQGANAPAQDAQVFIQRHQARVGAYVQSSIQITSSPTLSFDASPGRIGTDGKPTSGSGPGLVPLSFDRVAAGCTFPPDAYFGAATDYGCRAYTKSLYGTDSTPLICVQADPWGAVSQGWAATWNGAIPHTQGGRGRLVAPGAVGLLSLTDPYVGFCDQGVLGRDDVTASALGPDDPEFNYGGDQLVILSDVPSRMQGDPDCAPFVIPTATNQTRDLVALHVITASQDTLELDPVASNASPADQQAYVDLLMKCFPDPVSYEVRTLDVYSVVGGSDGFRHRVTDGGGQCLVDLSHAVDPCDPLTYENGRATPGVTYVSPQVTFEIEKITMPPGSEAQLVFGVGLVPAQTSLAAGTQPVSVVYNPTDGYLYSVDTDSIGVSQIALQPLNRTSTIK